MPLKRMEVGSDYNKIPLLIQQLDRMLQDLDREVETNAEMLAGIDPGYRKSATNLLHYAASRKNDLRSLQKKLKSLGMSRLANAGGHLKASLILSKQILSSLGGTNLDSIPVPNLTIQESKSLLNRHTVALMGEPTDGRRVRIMVTQPTEAAHNYPLVLAMVKRGMDCARINCAHDDPEIWLKIIDNIKSACRQLGKQVTINMDLAGPKIRTGPISPGPKVRKFSPGRDELGRTVTPALINLADEFSEVGGSITLPVPAAWRRKLRVGDRLFARDTRERKRKFRVVEVFEDRVVLRCQRTSYLGTGSILMAKRDGLGDAEIGEISALERGILLRPEDLLLVHPPGVLGEPAQLDEDGRLKHPAHISCQESSIFGRVKPGEVVLFDDGKIEGVIEQAGPGSFAVRITRAKALGTLLKAEKGINFPTSALGISGLTEKDRIDLVFVAKHADAVNFSFVNSPTDVEELLEELDKLGVRDQLSINLKIETRRGFDNLKEILLAAMKTRHIGVMIARGDLAVETGWDNIGWVQQEILRLCEAAHIPVIWATQVLENLAKKGLPSRSEITDATTSLRAECVMLNKGDYVLDAIALLDKILREMEEFEEKHESMLPLLKRLSE
jgi:pyruvate kinase